MLAIYLILLLKIAKTQKYQLINQKQSALYLPTDDKNKQYVDLVADNDHLYLKYVHSNQKIKLIKYTKQQTSKNYLIQSPQFQDITSQEFSYGSSLVRILSTFYLVQKIKTGTDNYLKYFVKENQNKFDSITVTPNNQYFGLANKEVHSFGSHFYDTASPFKIYEYSQLGVIRSSKDISQAVKKVSPSFLQLANSQFILYVQITNNQYQFIIKQFQDKIESLEAEDKVLVTLGLGFEIVQFKVLIISEMYFALVWVEKKVNSYSIRFQLFQLENKRFQSLNSLVIKETYSDGADCQIAMVKLDMNSKGTTNEDQLYLIVYFGKTELFQASFSFAELKKGIKEMKIEQLSKLQCQTMNQNNIQVEVLRNENKKMNVIAYCIDNQDNDKLNIQEIDYQEHQSQSNDQLILYLVIIILLTIFIIAAIIIVYKIRRKQKLQKQIVKLNEIKKQKKTIAIQKQEELKLLKKQKKIEKIEKKKKMEESILLQQQQLYMNIMQNQQVTEEDILKMQELMHLKKKLQQKKQNKKLTKQEKKQLEQMEKDQKLNEQIQMNLLNQRLNQEKQSQQQLRSNQNSDQKIKYIRPKVDEKIKSDVSIHKINYNHQINVNPNDKSNNEIDALSQYVITNQDVHKIQSQNEQDDHRELIQMKDSSSRDLIQASGNIQIQRNSSLNRFIDDQEVFRQNHEYDIEKQAQNEDLEIHDIENIMKLDVSPTKMNNSSGNPSQIFK